MDNLTAAETEDASVDRFKMVEIQRDGILIDLESTYSKFVNELSMHYCFSLITFDEVSEFKEKLQQKLISKVNPQINLTRRPLWHHTND